MTFNLDNLSFHSSYNTFKNDSAVYTGSIAIPTSVGANALAANTVTQTLSSPPEFMKFFANFTEVTDATNGLGIGAQWYPANVAVGSVAVHINSSPFVGYIGAFLYPIIHNGTITVRVEIQNPYSSAITLDAQTIPFAFIEYTLAS